MCASPSGVCSLPRQERVKAAAAWGTLTHTGRGVVGWPQLWCVQVACGGGTSAQLERTVMHLLWWSSLPVPTEAGVGMWGQWRPHHLHASQQWCLAFQADHTSSRGIPGHASPHSHPLCCICTANSAVSPDPFSQPHVLALSPCQYQWALVPVRGTQG